MPIKCLIFKNLSWKYQEETLSSGKLSHPECSTKPLIKWVIERHEKEREVHCLQSAHPPPSRSLVAPLFHTSIPQIIVLALFCLLLGGDLLFANPRTAQGQTNRLYTSFVLSGEFSSALFEPRETAILQEIHSPLVELDASTTISSRLVYFWIFLTLRKPLLHVTLLTQIRGINQVVCYVRGETHTDTHRRTWLLLFHG